MRPLYDENLQLCRKKALLCVCADAARFCKLVDTDVKARSERTAESKLEPHYLGMEARPRATCTVSLRLWP